MVIAPLAHDVRYAARALAASPGFTAAAVLTIALGIGINAGIFSIFSSVALRGVPAPDAEQLVAINQTVEGVPRGQSNSAQFSTADYEAYRDGTDTLSGLIAYGRFWPATLGGESQQLVNATPVSCNYFEVLRLQPSVGTGLGARYCENASDGHVAVLGHELWVRRFGSDPAILDRSITLNGSVLRVIGVAPEGFTGVDIDRSSLFVPISAQRVLRPDRNYLENDEIAWLNVVGRRREGASIERVETELRVIAGRIDRQEPGRRTTLTVARATPASAPEIRTAVLAASTVVMLAFGLVLLVACTNVANLLLARGDARARETAIRLSLGATRGRLVRQMLTESLLIALAGGALGSVFAFWSFQGLIAAVLDLLPSDYFQMLRIDAGPDIRAFFFAFAVSVAAGVAFGLAPALRSTTPNLRATIERDSSGAGHHGRGRLQGTLVGVQVAFCMVLVITTALLLRGLYVAQTVDPGFDYGDLVVAQIDLRSFGYEAERAAAFQRRLIERVSSSAGVDALAQAFTTPLEPRARRFDFRVSGQDQPVLISMNMVSPNYFSVVGIPIVQGRTFSNAELAAETTTAAILTESTARRLWAGVDPVGRILLMDMGDQPDRALEIVGLARDVQVSNIAETETSYIYLPAIEVTQPELQLVIRTTLPAGAIGAEVNRIVRELDPLLVASVRPLEENLEFWRRLSRVAAGLSFSLGALALTLAAIGVFGVMSAVVGRRVREIGIRVALGAAKRDVLRLVLEKSMTPVVIGAAVGAAACFGVSRLLSSLLFGVSALDPLALAGAAAVVVGVALVASVVPARRALGVDPMATLRHE